jgi:hypothetical protein
MERNALRNLALKNNWGLVVMLALLLATACQERRLPRDMVDTWVTDTPRYKGCYLLIFPEEVVFGAADANTHTHTIHRVKTRRQGGRIHFTIETIDDQQADTLLELVYLPSEKNGRLHFKHQPDVLWQRNPYLTPY